MTLEQTFDAIRGTAHTDTFMTTYAEMAAFYPYNLPEHALTFDNVSDVKRRVASSGSHYFDADAVRFFRGRTDGQLFGRRFWVESRKFVDTYGDADPREYQVAYVTRYAKGSLSVEKVGSYMTLDYARRAARALGEVVGAELAAHVDYPHEPGRLFDCQACESRCWCTGREGEEECVFEGVHYGTPESRQAFKA